MPWFIYETPIPLVLGYVFTLGTLLLFLFTRWTTIRTFFSDIRLYPLTFEKRILDPSTAAIILFSGALIAINCAPGLHPQFEIWYIFTVPFLCLKSGMSLRKTASLLIFLDFAWRYYWLHWTTEIPLAIAGQWANIHVLKNVYQNIRITKRYAEES